MVTKHLLLHADTPTDITHQYTKRNQLTIINQAGQEFEICAPGRLDWSTAYNKTSWYMQHFPCTLTCYYYPHEFRKC